MKPRCSAVRMPAQQRGVPVTITVDGQRIAAYAGEMLAAALMAAGIFHLRQSPGRANPRGAFCLMGVCQECVVYIDGRLRQACMVSVVDGLDVALIRSHGDNS